MSRLIQDLITNILLCLPVKALLRFRCLSEALCHEIDSAAFSKAHLNRSIQTKTRRQLIFLDQDCESSAIDFAGELRTPIKLCNPLEYENGYRTLYRGSCNGLLLLSCCLVSFYSRGGYEYAEGYGLWLWNPFTRKSKKLPDCPGIRSCYLSASKFGFGYDTLSDDYKIVQIHRVLSPDLGYAYKVFVFSLGSNTWGELPLTIPWDTFDGMLWNAVFLDGALHWLLHLLDSETIEILSFDISKEKFSDLMPAIPPFGDFPDDYYISLEVLEGGLVYCQFDPSSQH